ncbi:MAG: thioredoxin [Verrucomicrobiota bacterium]
MNLRNIENTAELDTLLQETETPVVVDFWAPWCGPCRALGPILEDTAAELGEEAVFVKVNVDENAELARSHRITSIPTLLYFSNGEVKNRHTGVAPKEAIIEKVGRISAQTV